MGILPFVSLAVINLSRARWVFIS